MFQKKVQDIILYLIWVFHASLYCFLEGYMSFSEVKIPLLAYLVGSSEEPSGVHQACSQTSTSCFCTIVSSQACLPETVIEISANKC